MSIIEKDETLVALAFLMVAYAILWDGIIAWSDGLAVGSKVLIVVVLGLAGFQFAGGSDE